MALTDVIQAALEKIQYLAKTEMVIGQPISAGETTIVPVSRVSVGFAAASGGKEASYGSGEGTGGGVTVTPVAFISICKDKVQVHSLTDMDPIVTKIVNMTPEVVNWFSKLIKKSDGKEEKDKKEE
jgi:uncharacterized spore protein YtfJ